MQSSLRVPGPVSYRPLYPEAADQGDPYLLAIPEGVAAAHRYYVYVTRDETSDGRGGTASAGAFPAFASDDLETWRPIGPTLAGDATKYAFWAPCVRYVAGLERPYVMLYSHGAGLGEQAHIGHQIRRADAEQPEGPFIDTGHVLTPDADFAIDADVYAGPDGVMRMAYAIDFIQDEPYGTGIVEVAINDDLTRVLSSPALLARPTEQWQLFDATRRLPWMHIPGVDWATDTVRWSTVEGPVGGLTNPQGRRVYLYSGGCYYGFYAVGALVENAAGALENVTRDGRGFVLGQLPEHGFYAPGHCDWFKAADGREWLVTHARFGSPTAPRNAALVELRWDADGLPYCPRPGE
ncbi:family 43 glycosylhydrolase [Longimicrobium terrae]|uniref:GH43 family beta-xylosidase n=1 Tax=Longimicrobium terrae TaxID=1639882 RepID=A0A841GU07_9BACT|nr:family 43 glycosylhydrolase [Longimicrobium terrae]MBB4635764.1 GH43 family beta-xylosidase [Longimicrobium terrae]MBB6070159.1 GH43 family beta-xylosidase [Longimicrobium terrae]NNC33060.1 family 43 glycosylhydrolase [Longimicrobium terrae]